MSELAQQLIAENKKTKAKTLDLGNCGLTEVPEEVLECVWLEELILSGESEEYDSKSNSKTWRTSENKGEKNQINTLPAKLSLLQNLKILIFNDNPISDLSPLARLNKLQELNCARANIDDLSALAGLSNLQKCFCHNTRIIDLSPLADLKNLQLLLCSSTKISDLSPLANLNNLHLLYCADVRVADLSPLAGLINLKDLNCSLTLTNDLSPLAGLYNLQELFCSSTLIDDLSPLAGLYNLQELHCSSTKISDLSPLTDLSKLQIVDCQSANVNDLSPILSFIKRGIKITLKGYSGRNVFDFKGCPLTIPPVEIIEQGNEAIIRYLEEIQYTKPEDVRLLNEAKLIVIGQPRAGKTSLRYKLCDTERALPAPDLTTRGIDIELQSFPYTDEQGKQQQFKYHIWDFGGQQIYHATHRFFLTKRTLYIAVVDTDVNDKQNDLDYWLHMIDLLGDGSPVFLVQNQKNDRSIEISDALRSRFRNIICAKDYEVNLDRLKKEGNPKFEDQRLKDFRNFKKDIEREFARLPQPAMTKQKNDARLALESLSKEKPLVEMSEYQRICAENGVPDKTAQLDLLRTLHNLGICLWYEGFGFLERIVILQNRWATDAVFKVLDNEVIKKKKGHFKRSDLQLIWSDPEYAGRVDELVLLMQRFKLCYQIGQGEEYIAPQLLDKNPPDDFSRANIKQGGVRMVIEYEFMPRGIITQFIVAMHRQISGEQRHAWETGFALKSIQGPPATGMAEESYDSRKLELWANGPGAGLLLQQMLGELEKIHESYNRLRYHKQIPCVCEHCSRPGVTRVKEFDYEEILLEMYQNRQPGIRCSFGNQTVSFEKLLGVLGFTERQTKLDYRKSVSVSGGRGVFEEEFGRSLEINLSVQNNNETTVHQPVTNIMENQPTTQNRNLNIYSGLSAFVVVMAFFLYAIKGLELKEFGALVIAGLLFIPLLGAFHVLQSGLDQKGFLEILKMIYGKIPGLGWLLKVFGRKSD